MDHLAQKLINRHQTNQPNHEAMTTAKLISDRIINIALSNIVDHPKNRKIDDEKVREYAESIREIGLIDNPVVTPVSNGKYMILSGHHRVKACRLLSETDHSYDIICCKVVDKDDIDAELILLHGNIKNNPLTPYEKMMAIGREEELLKQKGERGTLRSVIAQSTGLQATQVQTNLTVYKKAIPEVKAALKDGTITLEKARNIAVQSPEKQREHMLVRKEYKSNEIRELETIIDKVTKIQKMLDSFHPLTCISGHFAFPLKDEPLTPVMRAFKETGNCCERYLQVLKEELKEFVEVQAAEGTLNCKVCPYRNDEKCSLRVKYGNEGIDMIISQDFVKSWCPRLRHPTIY